MEDTWGRRDLPVLDAIVTMLDKPGTLVVHVGEIAERTGLEPHDVDRAIEAMDGVYIRKYTRTISGGDPSGWYVSKVTSSARRAVGQWPTSRSMAVAVVDGVAAAAAAAPEDSDPQRRTVLRRIGDAVGGTGRDVAVEVMAKVIERKYGLG